MLAQGNRSTSEQIERNQRFMSPNQSSVGDVVESENFGRRCPSLAGLYAGARCAQKFASSTGVKWQRIAPGFLPVPPERVVNFK